MVELSLPHCVRLTKSLDCGCLHDYFGLYLLRSLGTCGIKALPGPEPSYSSCIRYLPSGDDRDFLPALLITTQLNFRPKTISHSPPPPLKNHHNLVGPQKRSSQPPAPVSSPSHPLTLHLQIQITKQRLQRGHHRHSHHSHHPNLLHEDIAHCSHSSSL